jgi:hypothetical protein
MTHNDLQPAPTPLPVTRKSLIWSWTSFGISVITFLGAYISNLAGNTALMIVFAVVCTATMTFGAVLYLIRKAIHDAPQSKAVADGNSVRSVVIWKTLWLIPSLLMFFGLVRCIRGTTPDGIAVGVTAVLTLIPIIPTYIVLGIMRVVRKKR